MMWKWNVVVGVLIRLGSVCCRVTVRPQNTVAIRGERTSLECRTTDGSVVREWSLIPSSNPTERKSIIFSNWKSQSKFISPRFGVDIDDSGSGTLYTNETQFDDGGTYICSTSRDEEDTNFKAELIVLESKPVCSVREDVGSIRAECSVGFSGNWAPKMEWRHHSRREAHEDGTIFPKGIAYNNNGTHVTSKPDAFIINSAQDFFSVSCKIFFDARDHVFPNGSATNIPALVRIWTFLVIGSTDIVPDVSALTTSGLDVVRTTKSDQSTDATRNMENWTIILIGVVVFAIIVISVLSGAIVCIIRKKNPKNQCRRSVDAIYQKKTTRASDPNIYDSILLCDDNGYRIPLQDSIDGDSRIESPCRGSLDPYYVTTLTKLSTSREGEKIGKSDQMNEVKATNTEYQKMSKPRNDNVDSDEAAYYLQVICDSEDNQGGESESSSRQPSAISPTPVYTSLIL